MTRLRFEFFIRVAVIAAIALIVGIASSARAQAADGAGTIGELDAVLTLVSVDRASRTAILRGSDGVALSLTLPPDVLAYERFKPGDRFALHYVAKQSLTLSKGGVAGVAETQASEFVNAAAAPLGRFSTTRTVTLRVQQVNRGDRTVTVQDANNHLLTVRLDEDEQGLDELAVGDTLSIISTEIIELELVPSGAAAI